MKTTTGSREEILGIFSAVRDDQTNKISMQLFGKLLGEFERVSTLKTLFERAYFAVSAYLSILHKKILCPKIQMRQLV